MNSYSKSTKESLASLEIKKKCCREVYNASLSLLDSLHFEQDFNEIKNNIRCSTCHQMAIRAFFILWGNITNPTKSFHLEFSLPTIIHADIIESFLCEEGIPPKRTVRKGRFILYYKASSEIEDVLALIGANSAAFDIMNDTILREIRNNTNRQVNCDTHNIAITISTATEQIEQLTFLVESDYLKGLSAELQQTVKLRLDNPQASITELGRLHEPPISKSGCFHRLRNAIEISNDLKNRKSNN